MSVSDAVRMAIAKAGINQTELAKQWGTSPQAIYNKLNLERWSAADLIRIAAQTGGRLAFDYPDGQQILIQPSEAEETKKTEVPEKHKITEKQEQKKAPAAKKAAPGKVPAKKKAPAKKKEPAPKAPDQLEEQLSMFNL